MQAATENPSARVATVVARHEKMLLRVARQSSLCHDDAQDAYQRALEIFVRRVETVDPATELAWLKVVVRHEALAIRRSRSESVTGEELDLDAFIPGPERSVEDRVASEERVRRSAEALRALKPDEAQALMMKAHGLSYEEIGARNGWTYTKVNRAITEGRRRFMRAYEGIEAGEECERFSPIVQALAEGAATSAQVLEIRPHLRHCVACRATVRDLHLSRLRRASLFWPIFAVLEPLRRTSDSSDVLQADELVRPDVPAEELITPETIVRPDEPSHWFSALKDEIAAFFHRANASDVATGVHIATSSGGGRIASLGAMVALCLGSVGAGTVCVATGFLPDPTRILAPAGEETRKSAKREHEPPPKGGRPHAGRRHSPSPDQQPAIASNPTEPSSSRARNRGKGSEARPLSRRSDSVRDPAASEFGFEGRQVEAASSPEMPAGRTEAAKARTAGAESDSSTAPDVAQQEFDPAQEEFGP